MLNVDMARHLELIIAFLDAVHQELATPYN